MRVINICLWGEGQKKKNEKEMKREARESLKTFLWFLKWGIIWIFILLLFGVPFF
jgi:hypothetical protein